MRQIDLWGWQKDFFTDTSRVVCCVGGVGSGKSLVACLKMIAYCKMYPGAFVVIVRKNRESLRKSTLVMLDGLVVNDPTIRHVVNRSMYLFTNGSIILYAGMKDTKQREAVLSINADMIVMEEATGFDKADFEVLATRLRGIAGGFNQLILVTNPGAKTHWIKTMLLDTGYAKLYKSLPHQNPHLTKEFLISLNKLSKKEYQRFVLCEWVGEDESVYTEFDGRVHVIEPFDIDVLDWSVWRLYGAVDWGRAVPCAFQLWLHDTANDILYLYKEIYLPNLTVFTLLDKVNELIEDGHKPEWIVADHAPTERDFFSILGGFSVIPANKDISTGVKLVQERLHFDEDLGEEPHLFIFRNALSHEPDSKLVEAHLPYDSVTEFSAYMNMKDANGRILNLPRQVNDHAVDAARYLVMQVDSSKIGAKMVSRKYMDERRALAKAKGNKNWIDRAKERKATKAS